MEPKMPYLGILLRKCEKLLLYLKSASSNLPKCKRLFKTKKSKFGTKNALFKYFWARIIKNYCYIWNQHPQICQIAKVREKMKMPKFGTKNVLFVYFWAGIWKQYCHIWNQHPGICLSGKFREIMTKPKIGNENV